MRASDWALWLGSLAVVAVSNFLGGDVDPLTLIAALTGVTALMLAAKGQVFAQYLMIVFCLLYGAISCRFRYWGEMLTYLGMSLPMAVWSAVTWRRNTAHEAGSAVAIRRLTGRDMALLVLATVAVTALFGWLLAALDTPNLGFSILVRCHELPGSRPDHAPLVVLWPRLRGERHRACRAVGAGLLRGPSLYPRGGEFQASSSSMTSMAFSAGKSASAIWPKLHKNRRAAGPAARHFFRSSCICRPHRVI